ncbi:hypothetical protein PR048_031627 [Dryococelus australis]|uniref:Uncharacterized protein n=1 Tax=Dryococelus australis TaxID=614101 RepID=A0ABQ9G8L7_9NEOP|nr:hypothetical protein PR048_031627 [Dryococelus australis]
MSLDHVNRLSFDLDRRKHVSTDLLSHTACVYTMLRHGRATLSRDHVASRYLRRACRSKLSVLRRGRQERGVVSGPRGDDNLAARARDVTCSNKTMPPTGPRLSPPRWFRGRKKWGGGRPRHCLKAILHGTRFHKSLCKVCHNCRYTGLYGTRHGIFRLALLDFITGLVIGPVLFSWQVPHRLSYLANHIAVSECRALPIRVVQFISANDPTSCKRSQAIRYPPVWLRTLTLINVSRYYRCRVKGGERGLSPLHFSAKIIIPHLLTNAQLHHRGSKLDPRSDLRSTQKTVAPFEFRAGLEIEMKFISNRQFWRFEILIRDQQPSSTNDHSISDRGICWCNRALANGFLFVGDDAYLWCPLGIKYWTDSAHFIVNSLYTGATIGSPTRQSGAERAASSGRSLRSSRREHLRRQMAVRENSEPRHPKSLITLHCGTCDHPPPPQSVDLQTRRTRQIREPSPTLARSWRACKLPVQFIACRFPQETRLPPTLCSEADESRIMAGNNPPPPPRRKILRFESFRKSLTTRQGDDDEAYTPALTRGRDPGRKPAASTAFTFPWGQPAIPQHFRGPRFQPRRQQLFLASIPIPRQDLRADLQSFLIAKRCVLVRKHSLTRLGQTPRLTRGFPPGCPESGCPHVGIVPDHAAGRRFSRGSPVSHPSLHSGIYHPIDSRDLYVKKSRTNISTPEAGFTSLRRYSFSAGVDRSLVRDLGHPYSYQLACGGEEKLTPSPLHALQKYLMLRGQTLHRIPRKNTGFPNTFIHCPRKNVDLEYANRTTAYPAEGTRSIMWRVRFIASRSQRGLKHPARPQHVSKARRGQETAAKRPERQIQAGKRAWSTHIRPGSLAQLGHFAESIPEIEAKNTEHSRPRPGRAGLETQTRGSLIAHANYSDCSRRDESHAQYANCNRRKKLPIARSAKRAIASLLPHARKSLTLRIAVEARHFTRSSASSSRPRGPTNSFLSPPQGYFLGSRRNFAPAEATVRSASHKHAPSARDLRGRAVVIHRRKPIIDWRRRLVISDVKSSAAVDLAPPTYRDQGRLANLTSARPRRRALRGHAPRDVTASWATMLAKRLTCSPPTKAIRITPDFRMWESCRTMPLVGGFSRRSPVSPRPFIPARLHTHFNHPHRLSRPRC